MEVDAEGEIAMTMLHGCHDLLSSKALVILYFIHTCGNPIASDAQGELVSLFPIDPISQIR